MVNTCLDNISTFRKVIRSGQFSVCQRSATACTSRVFSPIRPVPPYPLFQKVKSKNLAKVCQGLLEETNTGRSPLAKLTTNGILVAVGTFGLNYASLQFPEYSMEDGLVGLEVERWGSCGSKCRVEINHSGGVIGTYMFHGQIWV